MIATGISLMVAECRFHSVPTYHQGTLPMFNLNAFSQRSKQRCESPT